MRGEISISTQRILLVEDNEDNQFIIEMMLSDTPYLVDIVENGEMACQQVMGQEYALILMDMQMPVMDGYTATRMIRKWEKDQERFPIPIIALTAHSLKEDQLKSLDAGCNFHLTKPINLQHLLETIETYVRHSIPPESPITMDKIKVALNNEFKNIIPRYLENREHNIIAILEWLELRDYEKIRVLGHSLKGSGTSYGFTRISEIGHQLELSSQKRDHAAIIENVQHLKDYLTRIQITY